MKDDVKIRQKIPLVGHGGRKAVHTSTMVVMGPPKVARNPDDPEDRGKVVPGDPITFLFVTYDDGSVHQWALLGPGKIAYGGQIPSPPSETADFEGDPKGGLRG